jgi:hypothetical protein
MYLVKYKNSRLEKVICTFGTEKASTNVARVFDTGN